MSAATITYSAAGRHAVSGRLLAYDAAAAVTFSGLPAGTGRFAQLTDATGQVALSAAAAVTANVATISLNTDTIDAVFRGRVRGYITALLTVYDSAGRVMATEIEVHAAAKPGTPEPTVLTGDYATLAQVQALIDAIVGDDDPEALAATADPGEGTKASRQDHVHPMPDAEDVGADAAGTAAGLMSTHTTTHPRPTTRDDRNEAADAAIQSHITGNGSPHTAAGVGALPGATVASLPAEPVTGTFYRLTTADATAKAAPGVYRWNGSGWVCESYDAVYDLGTLGATPSLALIPGAAYIATQGEAVTACAITMQPGVATIRKTGEYAFAAPTMTGRTTKELADGAWDAASAALALLTIENDGTYLIVSASELTAP